MPTTIGYILDTNIVIRLIRNDALGQQIDANFKLRASLAASMVCVVTVGELLAFARKFNWGKKKLDDLQKIIDELVCVDINRQEIIEAYSEIEHFSRNVLKPSRTMQHNDIWIAATANATGATLLTTDKDFDHLDPTYIKRIWIDPDSKAT